jgi:hypothetical protein
VSAYFKDDRIFRTLVFKLVEKSGVGAPEQPDVRNLVEPHRQSLEAEAKGPAELVASTCEEEFQTSGVKVIKLFSFVTNNQAN